LRVTAQLVDAASGYMIWSSQYDRGQSDLFKVQGEIAAAVATALQVSMVGDDPEMLSVGGTTNAGAFEAYLRGMKLHNERTPDSIKQARAFFRSGVVAGPQPRARPCAPCVVPYPDRGGLCRTGTRGWR